MRKSIPVFYHRKMVANGESFSPSAGKPKLAVESWRKLGIPLRLMKPEPVSIAQLELAHDERMVAEILACREPNGFGNRSKAVAKSLRWTSGAMLSAAKWALKHGGAAVAPCSGFHHATFDSPGGFCTFNGLMVTALVLRERGQAERIGILDLDQHYGNGTDDIIRELNIDWIEHFTGVRQKYGLPADEFLEALPEVMRGRFARCDVVLYQAGADPHINDPLGGWMTTEQLRERDRIVFRELKRFGVPVAWNLAGGYQRDNKGTVRPVLDIHDNTMRECAAVYLN